MKRIYQFLFVSVISMVLSLQANACGFGNKDVSQNQRTGNCVETIRKTANDNCTSSRTATSVKCYPCNGTGRVTCGGCQGKGYNPYAKKQRNILLVLYVEDLAQLDATLVEVEDGNKFLFSSHKGVSWAKVKYIYE